MPKCKKCGNDFQVPKNTIEMAYATYCKPCIKIGLRKWLKMPVKECIQLQAKKLLES